MKPSYVHGYDKSEYIRLQDQAQTLEELLHDDTYYPDGSSVLEAGCGVGAQTVILAHQSPGALFTSIDIAAESVAQAKQKIEALGYRNVQFQQADLSALTFAPQSFDHIFVCFVLEHLSQPLNTLVKLKRFLKPGGTMTVIEGDHGSVYFYPRSDAAQNAIDCQVVLQKLNGGNALIGRELYPLLSQAGFVDVRVSPRMVYIDASKPRLVEGFIKNTFIAMIRGIRDKVIAQNMLDVDMFDQGIRDLLRTTEGDGVFCYTFFKAIATIRPASTDQKNQESIC